MPLFYKQVFAFFNTYKEKQCNPTICTVSLLKKTICSNMRVLHKGKSIFLSIILLVESKRTPPFYVKVVHRLKTHDTLFLNVKKYTFCGRT